VEERASIIAAATSMIEQVGYRAAVDEDGDLAFKIEGKRGFFQIYDEDPNYARVWMQFGLGPDGDFGKEIRVANYLTRVTKAVKMTVDPDKCLFVASVECFFDEIEHLRKPMGRILNALVAAEATFYQQLALPETYLEPAHSA
jgi:hypothetical protein